MAVKAGAAGSTVANVDDVANALYQALTNQRSEVIAFTITPIEYQKVDRTQLPITQTTTTAATTTAQPSPVSQANQQSSLSVN